MASDFKVPLKIVVDGETSFKDAMKSCSDSMALLNSEGQKLSAQYKDNQGSLVGLAKQYENNKEKLEVQSAKVKLLREELEKEVEANGASSQKAIQLAKDLNKAETAEAKLADEVKKSKSEFLGLNDAFDKAKECASKLASVGFKAIEVGAKAAVTAVSAVATGAVAMGKAVFDAASEASTYGDTVDKGSQKMHVSAEQYQQLAYAADLSGTSINTLQKATVKLQQAGYTGDIDQAITELSAMTDETERNAAAQELFGEKIANELAPMLNQGVEGFEAAKNAASDYGLVMSDAAVKASAAFNDTKTTLIDTVSMIKTNLAAEFLPGINEVMEGITGIFTGDESAGKKIENGVEDIVKSLETVLPKLVNIFTNIVNTISEIAPKIISTLSEGIINNLSKLTESALEIIKALMEGLFTKENISALTDGAVNLITQLVTFISENAGMIIEAALTLVTCLMDSFMENDTLQILFDGVINLIGELVNAIIDNAPELITGAVELIAELAETLSDPEQLQGLIDSALSLVMTIVSTLIENAPLLVSAAIELASGVAKAIMTYDWLSVGKKIFESIKNSIKNAIKGLTGKTSSNGSNDNAGGLSYVPSNNYTADLHLGERVLTAAEAQEYRSNSDYEMLNAKVDMLLAQSNKQSDVNINVSGSAGAIVRALNVEIERENKRKSAF